MVSTFSLYSQFQIDIPINNVDHLIEMSEGYWGYVQYVNYAWGSSPYLEYYSYATIVAPDSSFGIDSTIHICMWELNGEYISSYSYPIDTFLSFNGSVLYGLNHGSNQTSFSLSYSGSDTFFNFSSINAVDAGFNRFKKISDDVSQGPCFPNDTIANDTIAVIQNDTIYTPQIVFSYDTTYVNDTFYQTYTVYINETQIIYDTVGYEIIDIYDTVTVYDTVYITSSIESQEKQFELFPNPVSDNLSISKKHEYQLVQLFIYNCNGILVDEISIQNNGQRVIDLTHLENGVYFFNVLLDNKYKLLKTIIKK